MREGRNPGGVLNRKGGGPPCQIDPGAGFRTPVRSARWHACCMARAVPRHGPPRSARCCACRSGLAEVRAGRSSEGPPQGKARSASRAPRGPQGRGKRSEPDDCQETAAGRRAPRAHRPCPAIGPAALLVTGRQGPDVRPNPVSENGSLRPLAQKRSTRSREKRGCCACETRKRPSVKRARVPAPVRAITTRNDSPVSK